VRDSVRLAEGHHLPHALYGEAGFGRTGLVVQAGVEDAGVVARLVAAHGGLLLIDGDLEVGQALLQPEGGGEADDSSADDGNTGGRHSGLG
jgi:hypothetical protein